MLISLKCSILETESISFNFYLTVELKLVCVIPMNHIQCLKWMFGQHIVQIFLENG